MPEPNGKKEEDVIQAVSNGRPAGKFLSPLCKDMENLQRLHGSLTETTSNR